MHTVSEKDKVIVLLSEAEHRMNFQGLAFRTSHWMIPLCCVFLCVVAPDIQVLGYDGDWYVGRENVQLQCQAKANPPAQHFRWIRCVSTTLTTLWNGFKSRCQALHPEAISNNRCSLQLYTNHCVLNCQVNYANEPVACHFTSERPR